MDSRFSRRVSGRVSPRLYGHASRRLLAVLVAGSLAALPAPGGPLKAQNLPNLGEEAETLLSPQLERRIGLQYYRELRASPEYLDDPEITAYVQSLGERLIAASTNPGMDVEFFMVKDNSINAFAMLGGFIGVNTGLLIEAQSESEVASVLGHELGHLIQKHMARQISASEKISIASMVAGALCMLAARSSSQGTQACAMVAMSVPVSQQLAYSRDFEREADRLGFEIMRKGGFDVTAMPTFFERLQRATRVYDANVPVYVRSHPLTTERIADIRNRVTLSAYRQHVDSADFALVRAKLRATMDPSVDGQRDAVTYFATQISDKTYTNLVAAHYGLAWALFQSRQYERAQAEAALLLKTQPHPLFEALNAALLLARKDNAGAVTAYRAAVAKYPRLRYLQLELIDALQKSGKHEDALAMLREQAQSNRSDPKVYEMQAKSYAALGKRMSQHQAQAENFAQLGRLQPAANELMVARCAGDGDFYQQSIIDARLRDIFNEMNEEKQEKEGKSGKDGERRPVRLPPMNERSPEARC